MPLSVDVSVIIGLTLGLLTLVVRAVHRNTIVRGRLVASVMALGAYALGSALLAAHSLSPDVEGALQLGAPLLLAFGVANLVVSLAVNPWRGDAPPERFPTIVQDTLVVVLFAIAASFVLQEKIFATTAVGAVVIGFALQDTLGNLFSGLAIQIEKPFRVGHWVRIGDVDALVNAITWRATKLRTKAGNFLIVPNSVIARDTVLNYSEPHRETRLDIEIGVSYNSPPNQVKAVILDAIRDLPLLSTSRSSEVLVVDFAAYAVVYRIRVWTTDFSADELVRDRVRTAVYYGFRRHNIEIPYPIQIEYHKEIAPAVDRTPEAAAILASVSIFSVLTDEQRMDLARLASFVVYAAGESVVKQGSAGMSMFVVVSGEAIVTLTGVESELARIGPGGFFGEMSLLTGDPRSATVRTANDAELLEITADDFRQFVLANPTAVELVGAATAERRAQLAQHAASSGPAIVEAPHGLVERMRRFLGLSAAEART